MSRILITTMPFTGHVTPGAAVAEALIADGHDVRFYTGAAFREKVESVGAVHVPWAKAPDFDENDMAATFPRLVGKKGLGQLLINVADCMIGTAPGQVEDLQAEWDREPWDLMVADDVSVGGVSFAELSGSPWATLSVIPLQLVGPEGPPPGMGSPGTNALGRGRDAFLRALVPLVSRPIKKPLDDARAAIGLPPTKAAFGDVVVSPHLIVASGCTLLDYERTDRPETVHFVGEMVRPPAASVDLPDWWGDLDGRRVVYVTQGTQNVDPADLLWPALQALAHEDAIVVATTWIDATPPFPVPSNARLARFIPHAHLLPRVDVVVSNGGWGGTLGALAHGIPMVIAGGDLDKPDIARRVDWSGAGIDLRTGTPRAERIADAWRRVAHDPSYRDAAARVGAQLNALGGTARAAQLIGELARSRARA